MEAIIPDSPDRAVTPVKDGGIGTWRVEVVYVVAFVQLLEPMSGWTMI